MPGAVGEVIIVEPSLSHLPFPFVACGIRVLRDGVVGLVGSVGGTGAGLVGGTAAGLVDGNSAK
jgi:hypothetical protein